MAVEAPLSKFKKNNLRLYFFFCLIVGLVFCYDGYLSKYKWSGRYTFYEEHLDKTGQPDSTMAMNTKGGPILVGAAIVLAFFYFAAKDRKLVAEENELKIGGADAIPYKDIESIDKTQFGAKGYFVITHKDFKGRTVQTKLSDRNWDNLAAILDELVKKIS